MHVNAYWIKIKYKSYLQFFTVCLKSYIVIFHVQKTNQETNKNLQLKTKNKKKLKNRSTQAREQYTTVIGTTSTSKRRQTACTQTPECLDAVNTMSFRPTSTWEQLNAEQVSYRVRKIPCFQTQHNSLTPYLNMYIGSKGLVVQENFYQKLCAQTIKKFCKSGEQPEVTLVGKFDVIDS